MSDSTDHLSLVRDWLKRNRYSAIIIPGTDPHQSEYIANYFKCRDFISGFTGSNGTLVVGAERAAVFTDSRYWLEAENVLSGTGIELVKTESASIQYVPQWILDSCPVDSRVCIDGMLISSSQFKLWSKTLSINGIEITSVKDPCVELWPDRPAMPNSMVYKYEPGYQIPQASEKFETLEAHMEEKKFDWYLVTSLDEIAWLLNLRADDIPFVPVPYAWLLVGPHGKTLFIDETRIDNEIRTELSDLTIAISPYHTLAAFFQTLAPEDTIFVPKDGFNILLEQATAHMKLESGDSFVSLQKAVKNEAEIEALRTIHVSDALALVRSYVRIEATIREDKKLDELGVEAIIKEERAKDASYKGESFSPIVAVGSNGSIVHYSAKPKSAQKLSKKSPVLIDTGGHYLGGTTDATRVLVFGTPSQAQKKAYTLVLKGHLALGRLVFPQGTSGGQLDVIARQFLWQEGLNYGHGTGHGVGTFLSVHEGPQRISPSAPIAPLKPGMLVTNEPGYYEANSFGIRIENMMVVKKHETHEGYLCFETLTLLPYEPSLIDQVLLTAGEISELKSYQARVLATLSKKLSPAEKAWLESKTLTD